MAECLGDCEEFFFLAFWMISYLASGELEIQEYQALLLIEVYELHFTYEWMQETLTVMILPNFANI